MAKVTHKTTKEDIIKFIKVYAKHDNVPAILEEMDWPHHRYQRVKDMLKKVRPELVPNKFKDKERLSALVEAALKEL